MMNTDVDKMSKNNLCSAELRCIAYAVFTLKVKQIIRTNEEMFCLPLICVYLRELLGANRFIFVNPGLATNFFPLTASGQSRRAKLTVPNYT